MTYFLSEKNKIVYAADAKKLVEWMRMNDTEYFSDNKEFMEMYSIRKWQFENRLINTVNEEKFIESIMKIGIIKKIKYPVFLYRLFTSLRNNYKR